MDGRFKRNLIVSSGISIFILIISATASFFSIQGLLDSNWWVGHTHQVIYNINNGQAELAEAQTKVRGYIITGNRLFLTGYTDYEDKVNTYFSEIAKLTSDNPKQELNNRELQELKAKFFDELQSQIADRDRGTLADVNKLENSRKLIQGIRRVLKQMEAEEQALLATRTADSEKYSFYSLILIVVGAIVAVSISLVFFVRILKDYNQRIVLQRELEKSEKETAERIRLISSIAGQISEGNYAVRVDDSESDALGSMGVSLNNMAVSLNKSFLSLSEKEWLQTGVAGLNKVMIGEKNIIELTRDVIDYICNYTGAGAGAFYVAEEGYLQFWAGYSFTPGDDALTLDMGKGITGQAAASGKMLELKGIPAEQITVSYALGEIRPSHIIAIPLIDDRVTGVIELAAIHELSAKEIEFLNSAAHNVAVAITTAKSRKRVQELLEETQAQSEELRVQHSEMESINAELEAQTEKLQASEEELRVQQEELQQTNEELAERSTLLEEKNMEIQRKSEDLELSTRYKSEFLANMSHELRTPLNSILLLSRLLSENGEENMSAEQVEFAKVINGSGHGLLGLIDEILDLSKIEAGKMELEYQDIAVNEVVNGLKALFGQVAKEKGITLNIDIDKAPLVLRTDKMRLEQILKNLLSNAIKFTSQGSVTLTVALHPNNDRKVMFSVKDTGIGIPREKQPLVFEAFQQADGSTKRKYGGTGLGLSISRELAKLLQGEITLQSAAGQGSTFTLSIPVIGALSVGFTEKPVTQDLPVPSEAAEAQVEQKDIKRYISQNIPESIADDRDSITEGDKSVLIVEDDVNFAKSLLEFTRKQGYKAIVSVRGDLALDLALQYRPVGVLLDIELPVKSGWEVMEELKNNPETRHIPVHIMSSHKLRHESLLKGAVNFLDKPVAYEVIPEIFTKIEQIVSKESQKVLIFEDNPQHAKALAFFLESNNINSEIRSEITEGIDSLQKAEVDCVILDMGVPDKHAYEMLENVKKNEGLENLPIIVFTGKSLSMKEELKIKKYADSIIVKTAHSYQRMLDEVSLFLHLVEEKKGERSEKKTAQLNNVLSNKNVLVVDDDVRNIYSLTKSLEMLKMNVMSAIEGAEALKVLNENPGIDVVLLDMMMPNMDGYETATRIRQDNRFKNLPVIAVTAKAMMGDREKCINAGASDYITKPVDVDQLMSLLRVWLYDKK